MKTKLSIRILMSMLVGLAWSSPAFCGEIHDAAFKFDVAIVKMLIDKDPSLVNSKKDENGFTPLLSAAAQGYRALVGTNQWVAVMSPAQEEIVLLLLSKGADINAKDNNGDTPLH